MWARWGATARRALPAASAGTAVAASSFMYGSVSCSVPPPYEYHPHSYTKSKKSASEHMSHVATDGGQGSGAAGASTPDDATGPSTSSTRVEVMDASSHKYAHLHPNLTVLDSRSIRCLFTIMRDENTIHLDFSQAADRLMRILAEEGLAHLPSVKPTTVRTPCGYYEGLQAAKHGDIAAVSIVRAGDTLLEAVRRVAPGVAVGKVLIQRQEEKADKEPRLYYSKLPHDIEERQVLLVDPMLATGGSAKKAIELLVERGVPQDHILFLCVVTCPEGLAALAASYPAVRVVTCAVDSHLNEHKYIVPGLGDFGDRYMGTDGVASTRSGGKNKPAPAHMG